MKLVLVLGGIVLVGIVLRGISLEWALAIAFVIAWMFYTWKPYKTKEQRIIEILEEE